MKFNYSQILTNQKLNEDLTQPCVLHEHTHAYLCLCDGAGALVLLGEEEADGHEELVDADAELVLVLAARGQREEPTGLDDVFEDVFGGLRGQTPQTSFMILLTYGKCQDSSTSRAVKLAKNDCAKEYSTLAL